MTAPITPTCPDPRPTMHVPGGWVGTTDCGRWYVVRRENAEMCDVRCLEEPRFVSFPLAVAWLREQASLARWRVSFDTSKPGCLRGVIH